VQVFKRFIFAVNLNLLVPQFFVLGTFLLKVVLLPNHLAFEFPDFLNLIVHILARSVTSAQLLLQLLVLFL